MTSADGRRPRSGSLARGAVVMTGATALSRITGFVRVIAVAAAMGTTFLANTYQTSNTAPNLIFELVAAGVLTSIFVPTFVEYLVRGEREEGWAAANVLATVALIGLVAIALFLGLLAEPIMRVLTAGVDRPVVRAREVALGATWLRMFGPQVVFYGVGMILTGALHAHRRFAMAAIAPIFNNVVVIVVYLTYAAMRGDRPPTIKGITGAETWLLGVGTTLGVVAMTVCLVPALRRIGWRYRFRPDFKHPAVRKATHLGAWAIGYAGGYQAGLLVVLLLANKVEGGVAAYQWAFTFFFVPHALFAVPIFNALFPAMSEHVARGESVELLKRLRDGLSMLMFVLIPVAVWMAVCSGPLSTLTLSYGVMTAEGARLVGRVIGAFAMGLPTYSAFLVITRAFYALGDTKTPTLVNAMVMAAAGGVGAALFFLLPDAWAVAGLALGHSLAFGLGSFLLTGALNKRTGRVGSKALTAAIGRATVLAGLALAVMVCLRLILPDETRLAALVSLTVTALAGGAMYLGGMVQLKAPELQRVRALFARSSA